RLTLTSPLDGVVLSAGLEKQLGRTVTSGQPLMEIAPLAALRAELRVAAADIARVPEAAAVRIVLDGAAGGPLAAQLARIRPRAELGDTGSYFVAEAILDNADAALRPGLTGRARISGHATRLGWRLLRAPVEAVRRWRGW
ncbi:MAG: HlyD family secretion protein, partial [Gammaproteobacteria bacterium]